MSWRTNASRSAGGSRSRTMSIASPIESARSASGAPGRPGDRRAPSMLETIGSGQLDADELFPPGRASPQPVEAEPRDDRRQPAAEVLDLGCRPLDSARSQASWTASSASASEPSIRYATDRRWGRWSSNSQPASQSESVIRSRSPLRVRQPSDDRNHKNVTEDLPDDHRSRLRPRLQSPLPPAAPPRHRRWARTCSSPCEDGRAGCRARRQSPSSSSTICAGSSVPMATSSGSATCARLARPRSAYAAETSQSSQGSSTGRGDRLLRPDPPDVRAPAAVVRAAVRPDPLRRRGPGGPQRPRARGGHATRLRASIEGRLALVDLDVGRSWSYRPSYHEWYQPPSDSGPARGTCSLRRGQVGGADDETIDQSAERARRSRPRHGS